MYYCVLKYFATDRPAATLLSFLECVDTRFIATAGGEGLFYETHSCSADLWWLSLLWERGSNCSPAVKGCLAPNFAAI